METDEIIITALIIFVCLAIIFVVVVLAVVLGLVINPHSYVGVTA